MILVDTSIWIDFFNNKIKNQKVEILDSLLKNKQKTLFITDIILTEILQGIREDSKYIITKNTMLSLPFVHAKNYDTYIHAVDIYRECRKKGFTIRKTIDCLIAAIAIENNLALLHNDRDFSNIAKGINYPLEFSLET
ncbi:MAG TPA: PIN domain nuclease [Bacillota bacterium]